MKNWFTKNLTIKIISVFLAILLWIIVLNKDNPYDTIEVTIPLKIENIDSLKEKSLVLKNEYTKSIIVRIRGRKSVLKSINAEEFTALLDFSKIKSAADTILKIDGPYYDIKDISIINVSPRDIELKLENIIEKEFPIEFSITGVPKKDYLVVSSSFSPQSVLIKDEESLINQVGSVKTVYDITDIESDIETRTECVIYDKKGEKMVTLDKNISIDIKINLGKEVSLEPIIEGTPSEDYVFKSKEVFPSKVIISGPHEIISKINVLETEAVDIEGISGDISVESPIRIPDDVKIVNGNKEADINVTVEKLVVRNLSVPREYIGVETGNNTDDNFDYSIQNDNVLIVLKGRQEDVSDVSINSINAYVDITGLGEGIHSVPLNITLPYTIKQIEDTEVNIEIKNITNPQETGGETSVTETTETTEASETTQ